MGSKKHIKENLQDKRVERVIGEALIIVPDKCISYSTPISIILVK